MCGISGGYNISRETIEKMVAHQHSRGPDNSGISQIGNVIFGHNRLSIIDKSEKSNQPIGESTLLTYNGEIYNLDNSIGSDTLALNEALQGDLEQSLNALNGMFAFAYFNGEFIYLVRDRFGVKPLYYYHNKDVFAFASTPAAIKYVKNDWKVSQVGVMEYISLGATQHHSLFDGILGVPPGHYVTFNVNTHEIKTKRWYYPKFQENALELVRERVRNAIDRVKLTCDWPQIILLSGGIDSTIVASRYAGQSAIHLRSPEQEYAEQVAKKFNIDLHIIDPEKASAEECLTDYIEKSGHATMAGLIPYITCKEIARLGYRVAITANGADELFFGYDRMRWTFDDQVSHICRPFAVPEITTLGEGFPASAQRQWFELQTYIAHDLNKSLDLASMAHSVEVRVPYLDHDLVEAALSIDVDDHATAGVAKLGNKTILKQEVRDLGFDWPFIHRPKMGFSLHYSPPDWDSLGFKALKWYKQTGYPQLTSTNGRHENYHKSALVGLYIWHKINGYD